MVKRGWRSLLAAALVLPLAGQEPTAEDLQDLQRTLEQPIQAASKRTQRLKEAPADVTVLRAEDLADLGYRTLGEALGGVLGPGRPDQGSYRLVLMDCQMPEMDGFEATRRIRVRQGDSGRIPIVALTANAMEGDRDRCLAAGMDDYLPKPIQMEALKAALETWI